MLAIYRRFAKNGLLGTVPAALYLCNARNEHRVIGSRIVDSRGIFQETCDIRLVAAQKFH
jgi:hypothetical protein